jgi:hypothetical protein
MAGMPFSPEWFERANAALAAEGDAGAVGESAPIAVEVVISGGEDGKLSTRWDLANGRLVAVRPVADGDPPPAASIPLVHADAAAIVAGERDPGVSYMRGDLKPEGRSAAVLALMSALARPSCRDALAAASS